MGYVNFLQCTSSKDPFFLLRILSLPEGYKRPRPLGLSLAEVEVDGVGTVIQVETLRFSHLKPSHRILLVNVLSLTFSNVCIYMYIYIMCCVCSIVAGGFFDFFWGVLWFCGTNSPIVKRSWRWWMVVVPRKTAAFVPRFFCWRSCDDQMRISC